MEENKNKELNFEEESSIDFSKIWEALKKHKRLYYKVLPATFIVACFFLFSIPNYYSCTVKLSPELSSSKSTGGLAALASSFGINLGGALGNGTEALFPTLYPDLMNSVDFKTSLFPVMVRQKDSTERISYYDYLKDHQRRPWWSSAIRGLFSLLRSQEEEQPDTINTFELTKEQTRIAKLLAKKVSCDVDKKTMVITIDVIDQDPLVCALMADSVKERLQKFITDYRTQKARVDLEYNKKLAREARERYVHARQLYVQFVDANQALILESVRAKQTDLENEMQLQYNAYNTASAQLIAAEAKVQQETPAFTTIQRATVPVKKAGPHRAKIVLIWLFLAFLGTSVWILHKENQLKPLLGLS